ncbi:olfactory receptor 14A2-like [Ornithorhynchus anatinus]|uniref:olfactory receptor 14A2-like n=1 Tax=Ornithorhynchus anatinus TaxID=9258 RepID=UPI00015A88A3|nr:olfactory receptor 14A2-like [Ornithorhynchus anatinus]
MNNHTSVTRFLLLGFSEVRELQLVHTALVLLVYLAALTRNLLVVTITTLDRHLHTPMYFFLRNLSILDLCLISVTVPKSILNSMSQNRSISFLGCVFQVLLVILFAASEMFVFTVMPYDRYVAICSPLRNEVVMGRGACVKMVVTSWFSGGLLGVVFSTGVSSLPFCDSHEVQQFFCDIHSLLKISCSEKHVAEDISIAMRAASGFFSFGFVVLSYIHIFLAVLRMPSSDGRSKAFSTCLPRLVVFTLFITTGSFAYLTPPSASPSTLDLLVSVFYMVVPPNLKPLIYSLRNWDMKATLGRVLGSA